MVCISIHEFYYFNFPPNSLPHPRGEGEGIREQLCGVQLPTGLSHDNKSVVKCVCILTSCERAHTQLYMGKCDVEKVSLNF